MDFRRLPDRPGHIRYLKAQAQINRLLDDKKDRLVEEGMLLDRAIADDDFWWFCRRFTSFQSYKIDEKGHPLRGKLWIDHPYTFQVARLYQQALVEPEDGWVWFQIHRLGLKTTLALALCLWVHSIDDTQGSYHPNLGLSKTIGLWTHKVDQIGTGMGAGALAQIQTDRLRDHYPQFRNLKEGTKRGYVVERPAGAREQSLVVQSILTPAESKHPDIILLDDVLTAALRGNVPMIAKIGKNLSDLAALAPPDCPVIVFNTPKDKADPLISREREGLFAKVYKQAATKGGNFTPAGEPNLHTAAYYARQRRDIHDDSIYYAEFELEFRERSGTLFSWEWIRLYDERPEEIAAASPYIHIIVDGAGGKKRSDFTVIRVVAWTADDAWANLELIRERIGASKAMQILLGRDRADSTSEWIESTVVEGWKPYCPNGLGLVEKWMRYDPQLTVWFDDQGNAGWSEAFRDHVRQRRITFGGKRPTVRPWPQPRGDRPNSSVKREGWVKRTKIQNLEPIYQAGRVAYPARGFGHGSFNGLAGPDLHRDTLQQFREDEYERMQIGQDLAFDDMLDTEAQCGVPQFVSMMRRPQPGSVYEFGGRVCPRATVANPFGVPGGAIMPGIMENGRTWASM